MEKLQGYKINNQFFETPLDLGGFRLIQAGRYYCQPNTLVPCRLHDDFFELTIVTDGKGTILTNGQEIPVEKNDIYVSFPFDVHGITSDAQEPLQYDHLAFIVDDELYRTALQEIIGNFYNPRLRVVTDSRVNYLTYCILGEFTKERPFSRTLIRNTVENIVVYIVRSFQKKEVPEFLERASQAEIFCNRIMNYIDTNIYSLENLRDLAAIANYNYNYISTVFQKTTGYTLRNYYVKRKLEVADMLVTEGKLKIHEIAEKLHYSSGNALTKAYKQKYGFSPTKKL